MKKIFNSPHRWLVILSFFLITFALNACSQFNSIDVICNQKLSTQQTEIDPDVCDAPDNPEPTDPEPTEPQPAEPERADLSISKLASATQVMPGDSVTYSLTIMNKGPDLAENVVVTDVLPSGLSFISSSACEADVQNSVSCKLGDLAFADVATLTLKVNVDETAAAGKLRNTATVNTETEDPVLTNNQAYADLAVGNNTPVADLTISQADSTDPILAGKVFSYTLKVENKGPDTASKVVITNSLPAEVSFESSAGCRETAQGEASCELGDMVPNSTREVSLIVSVNPDSSGRISNTARVDSDTVDPDSSNNATSETTVVQQPQASLALTVTSPEEGAVQFFVSPWDDSLSYSFTAKDGNQTNTYALPENGFIWKGSDGLNPDWPIDYTVKTSEGSFSNTVIAVKANGKDGKPEPTASLALTVTSPDVGAFQFFVTPWKEDVSYTYKATDATQSNIFALPNNGFIWRGSAGLNPELSFDFQVFGNDGSESKIIKGNLPNGKDAPVKPEPELDYRIYGPNRITSIGKFRFYIATPNDGGLDYVKTIEWFNLAGEKVAEDVTEVFVIADENSPLNNRLTANIRTTGGKEYTSRFDFNIEFPDTDEPILSFSMDGPGHINKKGSTTYKVVQSSNAAPYIRSISWFKNEVLVGNGSEYEFEHKEAARESPRISFTVLTKANRTSSVTKQVSIYIPPQVEDLAGVYKMSFNNVNLGEQYFVLTSIAKTGSTLSQKGYRLSSFDGDVPKASEYVPDADVYFSAIEQANYRRRNGHINWTTNKRMIGSSWGSYFDSDGDLILSMYGPVQNTEGVILQNYSQGLFTRVLDLR